jgi:hypothetical protein
MHTQVLKQPRAVQSYVSTGHLPPDELTTRLVNEACECFKSNADGEVSQIYPALVRGGMVKSFNVPPTTVVTGIVA